MKGILHSLLCFFSEGKMVTEIVFIFFIFARSIPEQQPVREYMPLFFRDGYKIREPGKILMNDLSGKITHFFSSTLGHIHRHTGCRQISRLSLVHGALRPFHHRIHIALI
jgi:hypothetical protein